MSDKTPVARDFIAAIFLAFGEKRVFLWIKTTNILEQLLHYVWKHRLFPLEPLTTADGRSVEVIDPGLHNGHAGPDFFNAKVRIGGTLWVGNVEIHDRSSDWYVHGHDRDAAYDNVVLHIAGAIDRDVVDARGRTVTQMRLDVPQSVADNYRALLSADAYPPCYRIVPQLSSLMIHSWMSVLQTERLSQKTKAIERRADMKGGSWEDAYFITLARNYGFGVNGDAFERWAMGVPLNFVGRHADNLFQIEALFMGQAGLLSEESIPLRHRAEALGDGYFIRLSAEYKYLAHKFSLEPMDCKLWRFLRLRPQNFPHIRIAQMANLYYAGKMGLGALLECDTVEQLRELMRTQVTPYWETHYSFGSESGKSAKRMSAQSVDLLVINTAIPMLFAYGRHTSDERLCDRAFEFLDSLKAENNNIIRMWRQCGLDVRTAGDSQALVQLKKEYCDRKDCLCCRIGYEYLKNTPMAFAREDSHAPQQP